MKTYLLTASLLFTFVIQSFSQYTETFDSANKGILLGPCTGSSGETCNSFDFDDVDWTIDGLLNLSGIDSEGLFTKSGYLHFEDVDEEACWVSPILDISGVPTSSVNVQFTIPTGASWESSTTVGSIDYMDVKYSVDEAPYITVANINGCPGSGHTLSSTTCGSSIAGPFTANVNQSGIVGNVLRIRVCVDTNASSDDGWLETVSVPEGIILPVTWSSIAVSESREGPLLQWSTSYEKDSDQFEIERLNPSTNKFEKVGEIEAAGYSTKEVNYEFTDSRYITNNLIYYRIKQIDYNGEFSFSEIVSIKIDDTDNEVINVYPNPVNNSLYIDASNEYLENVSTIKIYNMLGALENQLNFYTLKQSSSIDVTSFTPGVYFIRLEDENEVPIGEVIRFYKM